MCETVVLGVETPVLVHLAGGDVLSRSDAGLFFCHWEITEVEATEHVVRVEVVEFLVGPYAAMDSALSRTMMLVSGSTWW